MRDILLEIQQKLSEIEKKEQVHVLYAVESGSRSWGVASTDSDYDVRFIYVRPQKEYLKLQDTRDVIEWQLDEVLDINGWDLKKALQQFYKGNATLFEWCRSPVVYKNTGEWKKAADVGAGYFSNKTAMYHYYGLARKTWEKYLTGFQVMYKKYIYALRPILSCRYIEANHEAPPVVFADLMDQVGVPPAVKTAVDKMLDLKMETGEKKLFPPIPQLQEYIAGELERIPVAAASLQDDRDPEWNRLNAVFLELIY